MCPRLRAQSQCNIDGYHHHRHPTQPPTYTETQTQTHRHADTGTQTSTLADRHTCLPSPQIADGVGSRDGGVDAKDLQGQVHVQRTRVFVDDQPGIGMVVVIAFGCCHAMFVVSGLWCQVCRPLLQHVMLFTVGSYYPIHKRAFV